MWHSANQSLAHVWRDTQGRIQCQYDQLGIDCGFEAFALVSGSKIILSCSPGTYLSCGCDIHFHNALNIQSLWIPKVIYIQPNTLFLRTYPQTIRFTVSLAVHKSKAGGRKRKLNKIMTVKIGEKTADLQHRTAIFWVVILKLSLCFMHWETTKQSLIIAENPTLSLLHRQHW